MRDLGTAIDDVARRMTDDAPPVDVRTRVLARLDERAPSRWIWRVAPVAAAISAVAAIAWFVTSAPRSTKPPAPPAVAAQTPPPPVVTRLTPSSQPHEATLRPRSDAIRVAAADRAWRDRALPVLTGPDAITFERIQPTALEIRPLHTAPLTVPPFDDDGGRERN